MPKMSMMRLVELIKQNEDWLMERILGYAKRQGYTQYTSTRKEDWRLSIAGISGSLVSALARTGGEPPELGPEEDFRQDPSAAFGVREAIKHRERGVDLAMFLGLLKYYRQGYQDLVGQADFEPAFKQKCGLFIKRFFDRVEIGFLTEWMRSSADQLIRELQAKNRAMTNEKNKYLTIFESLADPVIWVNRHCQIEDFNLAFLQLLGRRYGFGAQSEGAPETREQNPAPASGPVDLRMRPVGSLFQPEWAWLKEKLDAFIAGSDKELSFEHDLAEGARSSSFRIKAAKMLDVSEKYSGIVISLNDQTELKRAERSLAKALDRAEKERANWEAIFNAAPVGMLLLDRELKVTRLNEAAARISEPAGEGLIGQPPGRVINCFSSLERGCGFGEECKNCEIRGSLVELAGSGRPFRNREAKKIIMSNGRQTEVWFSLAGEYVTIDGRPNLLLILDDITERKRMDQLKKDFISIVSHELRTPLTSILGALGLIRGGVVGAISEEMGALLEMAFRNSERLVGIVNDMLDLEKMESGKLQLHLQPFPLQVLVEKALEANFGYAEKYGVKFRLAPPAAGALVRVDPERFLQVMANLLSNAVKFSPPQNEVEIRVAHNADSVRVSVTDHGAGIPEQFRDRVFEKFAQADSSDSRTKGGSGLGLSICKEIIEQFGGTIAFSTRENEGTTFYFELPKLEAADELGGNHG